MAVTLDDAHLKFTRAPNTSTGREGLKIWEVPGAGLYQVAIAISRSTFTVSTLSSQGWTELITLNGDDGIPTPEEALERWLEIQSRTESADIEQEG